jgi:FAD/FMN-containing dehydrogenase
MRPTWRNHTGNQVCRPREILKPASLKDLRAYVSRAEGEDTTIRMVGAGHSWSDVALTDGYLALPDELSGVSPVDESQLRPAWRGRRLVRALGGTHVSQLNAALDGMGLALLNMGGYDAQTISGVVSTSTHGSGLAFGPFPDMVRSLDVVASGGEALRIEPADGPTDPARFAGDELRLVQDDRRFYAAVCGMGTLGLIHSLVIEVREKFWLQEERTLSSWEEARDTLTADGVLGGRDHYELFVNPYAGDDGRHRLLVTRRSDAEDPGGEPDHRRNRHPLTELEASSPLFGAALRFLARRWPRYMPGRFDDVLANMRDRWTAVSYEAFNIGEANHLPAYSAELGVSIEGGRHLEAVDRILAIAEERRHSDRLYHTSPFSLRFVAPSKAYASMMYERPTMMIELIMVDGTRGGYRLLDVYEKELADLEIRPHWGQYNTLTRERIEALYPRWADWMAVERELNASGVFDSQFTERVGISARG